MTTKSPQNTSKPNHHNIKTTYSHPKITSSLLQHLKTTSPTYHHPKITSPASQPRNSMAIATKAPQKSHHHHLKTTSFINIPNFIVNSKLLPHLRTTSRTNHHYLTTSKLPLHHFITSLNQYHLRTV
jgi:hypothetical protein